MWNPSGLKQISCQAYMEHSENIFFTKLFSLFVTFHGVFYKIILFKTLFIFYITCEFNFTHSYLIKNKLSLHVQIKQW